LADVFSSIPVLQLRPQISAAATVCCAISNLAISGTPYRSAHQGVPYIFAWSEKMRKSCQIRGSEIAKKWGCFASFCIIAKNRFTSEKVKRKAAKWSEKKTIFKWKSQLRYYCIIDIIILACSHDNITLSMENFWNTVYPFCS
jgi:hypothetical protein